MRSFLPEPADDEEELLQAWSPRVLFGHTHLPFRRSGVRGIELVNPGSVGMPFDGDPRAAYALIHPDRRSSTGGSRTTTPPRSRGCARSAAVDRRRRRPVEQARIDV